MAQLAWLDDAPYRERIMLKSLIGPWEVMGYFIIAMTALIPLVLPLPHGMETTFWVGLAIAAVYFVGSGLIMHRTKIYKTGKW